MSPPSIAILGLAAVTLVFKGAGAMFRRVPEPLARRLGGLAPALLAALVVSQLLGDDGVPELDAKLAGVAVAVALTAKRVPLAVCVIAGAVVAAALRALA